MNKTEKEILSKLQRPLHYTYISKYILNKTDSETLSYLSMLVEQGLIKVSDHDGYYVVVNN